MKRAAIAAGLALWACDDEPPPSCQQAVTHFYEVGCAFFDLSTNPPTPYTVNESILDCKNVNAAVPDRCQSFFDDYMFCLNDATAATCAGCTQEQDALFGCQ